MAEITARLVKDLRELTGVGMMECKRALVEAKGDIGDAEVLLRKWGIASAGKKSARTTKQGLIGSYRVSLSTAAGVAGMILTSVQRGYDLTWLDGYPQAIRDVTRDQVNHAIRAHLDPQAMTLVEAGSVAAAAPTPPPP